MRDATPNLAAWGLLPPPSLPLRERPPPPIAPPSKTSPSTPPPLFRCVPPSRIRRRRQTAWRRRSWLLIHFFRRPLQRRQPRLGGQQTAYNYRGIVFAAGKGGRGYHIIRFLHGTDRFSRVEWGQGYPTRPVRAWKPFDPTRSVSAPSTSDCTSTKIWIQISTCMDPDTHSSIIRPVKFRTPPDQTRLHPRDLENFLTQPDPIRASEYGPCKKPGHTAGAYCCFCCCCCCCCVVIAAGVGGSSV